MTRTKFKAATLVSLLLAGASTVAWGQPANAQESGPESEPQQNDAGASDSERKFSTVIVTAQRREESQIEVPIAISAVSGDVLEKAGLTDVNNLQLIVPGLTFSFAGAHFQPTIRGVGTQVSGPGLPSNVAIYLDGFYRPNPVMNNFQLNDIESVQVLKGPQGTLYGRNATGGAVIITTRAPEFDPSADVVVSYRSYEDKRAGAFITGPITDQLAGSLAFYTRDAETYYDNLVPGVGDKTKRSSVFRGKLLFQPSDRASFELMGEYSDIYDPSTFMFTNYEGISVGNFIPGAIVSSAPYTYSNDYRPMFDSESKGVFLKSEIDLTWADLSSFTSYETQKNYSGYDVDSSSAPVQHVDFPGDQETLAQEFILSSKNEGPLDWLVGAFFLKDEGGQTLLLSTPPGYTEVSNVGVKTESFAVYADATYQFADRLFVNGGLRFSQDKLTEFYESALLGAPYTEAEKKFSSVTPRIGLRFQIDDDSSLYASYNAGYKSGGFNPSSLSTAFVKPETIDAFELGYKLSNGTWDLNLAAYHYTYQDLQVTAYEGPITQLVNAAEAKIDGAEAEVSLHVSREFTLSGGLSYNKSEYKSFPGAPQYSYDPLIGITVAPGNATGNPLVNAPELAANLNAIYVKETSAGSLELSANASYQSDTYFDAFQTTKQPAYSVLNLRAGWVAPDGVWGAALFANNVTDEEYVRSIFQQPVAFSASYAAPRVVGVELTYKLGR